MSRFAPPSDALPIPDAGREKVLMPFTDAAASTLTDWALTESFLLNEFQAPLPATIGDVSVAIELRSAAGSGLLVVSLAQSTAAGLADRVLAEAGVIADEAMVLDCAGELANLIAGHAKAMFKGSSQHFDLGTPIFGPGVDQPFFVCVGRTFLVATIGTDLGEMALHIDAAECAPPGQDDTDSEPSVSFPPNG